MAKSKSTGNKSRNWIIRVVVFSVLGVVLVLAALDYKVKQEASKTGEAWRALLQEANDNHAADLPLAKLQDSLEGSPTVTENDLQNVYTWKGMFRSYSIQVAYDQTPVKVVTKIEGP